MNWNNLQPQMFHPVHRCSWTSAYDEALKLLYCALGAYLPKLAVIQELLHQLLSHLHSRVGRSWDGNLISPQTWRFSPVNQGSSLEV